MGRQHLPSKLTCTVPSRCQGVLLGPKGEEALLGTVEPDAGLLEAVEVPQGQSLVPRAAEHRAAGRRGSEKNKPETPNSSPAAAPLGACSNKAIFALFS